MKRGLIYTIKDLPISERPRERLIRQGAKALSDAELLAVILRTGTRYENVVDLAKRMLREFNIKALSQASLSQLKGFFYPLLLWNEPPLTEGYPRHFSGQILQASNALQQRIHPGRARNL